MMPEKIYATINGWRSILSINAIPTVIARTTLICKKSGSAISEVCPNGILNNPKRDETLSPAYVNSGIPTNKKALTITAIFFMYIL